MVNVVLGNFFRNPKHAPFTSGYLPAQHTVDAPMKTRIAGLAVEFYPAPSDATDSTTIWFPQLKLAINNLLWPALFNVFAIQLSPRALIIAATNYRVTLNISEQWVSPFIFPWYLTFIGLPRALRLAKLDGLLTSTH